MIPELADDAAALCHDLLRIDTSNPGRVERPAAEYVAEKLTDVGLDGEMLESEPGRSTYVVRMEGEGTNSDALLVHGHLDVVPAVAADWRHHPFSGELADGCLWGRGAVDMKDMVAMMTAVVRRMRVDGIRPKRDIVLAYFADEEAAGPLGAEFMVNEHRDLFEGVTAAIGEVGGFSVTVKPGLRLYPIQVAEKGLLWLRLRARGRAGHGSMPHQDNAVQKVAEAVARLGRARFARVLTPATEALLEEVSRVLGIELDREDLGALVDSLGPLRALVEPVLCDTVSPTMLSAGQKVNVIPSEAEASVDCRFLPGHEEGFVSEIDRLIGPQVVRETIYQGRHVEAPWDHPLVRAMCESLIAFDPSGHPVPHMISGGTDAKHLSRLRIDCYGFSPLLLPPDLDFGAMFHGVDERVPVDALGFGARVLYRLLINY